MFSSRDMMVAGLKDRPSSGLDGIPRLEIGLFPTPLREVCIKGHRRFWLKDDGVCSALYGGNKVRKLEYLLADAQRRGARRLVVHGDLASHTVMACGLLGRCAGFDVDAVVFPLHGQTEDRAGLVQLADKGVHIHRRGNMLAAIAHAYWLRLRCGAFLVPLGASTTLATLGYVQAGLELIAQVHSGLLTEPQQIYIPFATGGSVAGLLIGLTLAQSSARVIAVQTVESIIANRRRVERLVRRTLELLGPKACRFGECMARLEIQTSFLGSGYHDVPTETSVAIAVAAEHGLELETAFTGKAFAALLAAARDDSNRRLLFWNTHAQQCANLDEPVPMMGAP